MSKQIHRTIAVTELEITGLKVTEEGVEMVDLPTFKAEGKLSLPKILGLAKKEYRVTRKDSEYESILPKGDTPLTTTETTYAMPLDEFMKHAKIINDAKAEGEGDE